MKTGVASRRTAVQIGLLLQAVLLLDLALRSITRLPAWQIVDEIRLVTALASGQPVDHTYMTFLPDTIAHFDVTLVQFGYLSIAMPAATGVLLVMLTLWVRGFSNRVRLTVAILEAGLALVMVPHTQARIASKTEIWRESLDTFRTLILAPGLALPNRAAVGN